MAILATIGISLYVGGIAIACASKLSKLMGWGWREPKIRPYLRVERDPEMMTTNISVGIEIIPGGDVLVYEGVNCE